MRPIKFEGEFELFCKKNRHKRAIKVIDTPGTGFTLVKQFSCDGIFLKKLQILKQEPK